MRSISKLYWHIIYAVFPIVRDGLLRAGLIWHTRNRQLFPIGYLRKGISNEEFRSRLISLGFEKNIIAWIDTGEMISMRLISEGNRSRHCHVRLFEDGEIRGHSEKTPEKHPIDHFFERGMEDQSSYIRTLIGASMFEAPITFDFVSGMTISQSAPATSRALPTNG